MHWQNCPQDLLLRSPYYAKLLANTVGISCVVLFVIIFLKDKLNGTLGGYLRSVNGSAYWAAPYSADIRPKIKSRHLF